jgi:hypothetical protein
MSRIPINYHEVVGSGDSFDITLIYERCSLESGGRAKNYKIIVNAYDIGTYSGSNEPPCSLSMLGTPR